MLLTPLRRVFSSEPKWRQTTILALKRNHQTIIIGDGQVTYGPMRVKTTGNKIRKLHDDIYCGFAGTLADCFTLMEGLQTRIIKSNNQTLKACIDYAKEWRTGKYLKDLQATMIVIDKDLIIEMDGTGNVMEIDDVIGIGSGGQYAQCAARALLKHTNLSAEEIARSAMEIAADKCIYTSNVFRVEKVVGQKPKESQSLDQIK